MAPANPKYHHGMGVVFEFLQPAVREIPGDRGVQHEGSLVPAGEIFRQQGDNVGYRRPAFFRTLILFGAAFSGEGGQSPAYQAGNEIPAGRPS